MSGHPERAAPTATRSATAGPPVVRRAKRTDVRARRLRAKRKPEGPARALLKVIEREPEAALRALAAA